MWPGQRLQLAVWADELQTRGEPLGEQIANSLRADELVEGARFEPALQAQAATFAEQTERSRRELIPQLLEPEHLLPGMRLRWQCGVVRALEFECEDEDERPTPEALHTHLYALAQRPVMRWLDRVVIRLPEHYLSSALKAFREPKGARPRLMVVGRWPGNFRRVRDVPSRFYRMMSRYNVDQSIRMAPEWGLSWLMVGGEVQALPWAKGEAGDRLLRLDELITQIRTEPNPDAAVRRLACACWDSSERVRRRLVGALPQLPDAAAPLALVALAQFHAQRGPGGPLDYALSRIAEQRPEWISAIAHNFSSSELWVARWLARISSKQAHATAVLPKLHAMISEHEGRGEGRNYQAVGLRGLLGRFPPGDRPPLPPSHVLDVFEDHPGNIVS